MAETTFSGLHHIALNVRDLEASARWYADLLGFQRLAPYNAEGFQRILMRHPAGLVLGLTKHDAPEASDAFSERRTGLDHVAFEVADRAQLEDWVKRLDERGIGHSEIRHTPLTGSYLVIFRDPDNIQLELYAAGEYPTR